MTDNELLLRVRLLGGPATASQLDAVALSTKAVGDAAETTGTKEAFAAEKSFLFGESMYSLRRYAFYALTAIGATGAGILKMGYDFDEAKSRGVGALTALTGGTKQATAEVNKLVRLTFTSGLGLSTLTAASQQMLTFGFSVRQTNAYLAAFANYSGRMGLGASGVTSLSAIFNKIRGQGFLNSREFNELTALGIPGYKLMSEGLGLTSSEQYLLQHGQLSVPSSAALPELASWLNRYSATQGKDNTGYQLSRLHQMLSAVTGTLGAPVFSWLDGLISGLTKAGGLMDRLTKAKGANGILTTLDPSQTLLHAWQVLGAVIHVVWDALRDVLNILSPYLKLLGGIAAVVLLVSSRFHAFGLLAEIIAGVYLIHLVLEISRAAQAMKIFAALEATTATFATVWAAATDIATVALWALTGEMSVLDAAMLIFDTLDPITWILLLAVGLGVLYWKVKPFRDAVNMLFGALETGFKWALGHWPLLLEILTAPFDLGLGLILTHLSTVWRLLRSLWSWVENHIFRIHLSIPGAGLLHGIEGAFGFGGNSISTPAQLLSQQGSLQSQWGASRLAQMDANAGLTPAQVQAAGGSQRVIALLERIDASVREHQPPVVVKVDSQTVAEANAKGLSTAEARR